ncbi:MAG: ABC transporter substrate-binding protein [Veillonellaceae bacterium]|nr:ABC transporter substrate-binding protein [Veillonellaceae bacterium]
MKKRMKMWALMAGLAVLAAGCGGMSQETKPQSDAVRVGIVQLVEHPALDAAEQGMTDALNQAFPDGKIEILHRNAQGDQGNLQSIAQSYISGGVQLIGAVSTPAAQAMANRTTEIPIVGTAISDYVAAKLVNSNEAPGTNVTGTTDRTSEQLQVELLQALFPQAKRIGVLYNSGEINSQLQVESLRAASEAAGLTLTEGTVSNVNDVSQVAQSLLERVDVVYVPTDNVLAAAMPTLTALADEREIPVIGAAASFVADGAVAALSVDYYQLGYRAGEMAAAILKGEAEPETTAITSQEEWQVVIRKDKAAALGVTVPEKWQARVQWQ